LSYDFNFTCLFDRKIALVFNLIYVNQKLKLNKYLVMSIVKRNKTNFPALGVWDNFFNDEFFRLPESYSKMGTTLPSVNIQEDENAYKIEMAAPGKEKADFNIEVHDKVLSISSENKSSSEETDEGKYTRKEFSYESFKRSFRLPENADEESIVANYENGILSISIPKVVKNNGKKQISVS